MQRSPKSYTQLEPEDRMTIVSRKQQNYSILHIAEMLQAQLQPQQSVGSFRATPQGAFNSFNAQQSCCQQSLPKPSCP
jgi:hypothetical protein